MDNTNDNFRLCSDFQDLESHIVKIRSDKFKLILWQNLGKEKKIIQAYVCGHYKNKNEFYIELISNETALIARKKNLFLYCQEMNLLVKGSISQLTRSQIKLQADIKFYLEEKRKNFRIDFINKNIDLKIIRIDHNKFQKNDQVKLKNLSNQGYAFIISASRAPVYYTKMEIHLLHIGKTNLNTPIIGHISHITPVKAIGGINDHSILVGVCFNKQVENIDHLVQQIELGMTNLEN